MLGQPYGWPIGRYDLLRTAHVHGVVEKIGRLRLIGIDNARLGGHLNFQREQQRINIALTKAIPGKGNVTAGGIGQSSAPVQAQRSGYARRRRIDASPQENLRFLRCMRPCQHTKAAEGGEGRQQRPIQRHV